MDTEIIDSWNKNAAPWVTAVRDGEIESRLLVTNRAIVEAVRSRAPASGIDIGCGEGWLVRALDGIAMTGVDVVPGLVDAARAAGGGIFRAAPTFLRPGGALIVQTMHPVVACGDAPYRDGWRTGSWAGFNAGFTDPPPWYFRTLGSWVRLYADHGLQLQELREPVHPKTGKPASLILIGQLPLRHL